MKENDCIQLFEVGDELYRVCNNKTSGMFVEKIKIIQIDSFPHYVYRDDKGHSYFNHNIVKSCFKTQEEAENEIQKRKNIIEKRTLLKEYERELNKRFNICDHYIVK